MATDVCLTTAARRRPATPVVHTDLERFWPSRRGHAFDEFCRPSC